MFPSGSKSAGPMLSWAHVSFLGGQLNGLVRFPSTPQSSEVECER